MEKKYAFSQRAIFSKTSLLIVALLMSFVASSQKDAVQPGAQKPVTKFTIGAGLSLINSFNIGNADLFYQHISGNSSLALDDGAGGFKFISMGLQTTTPGKGMLGLELQCVLTHPSHAIAGEDTDYGFATRMYFNAKFVNLALKLGLPLGKKSYLVIEPGMDAGFMNGKTGIYNSLYSKTYEWLENSAYGLGGHLAGGFDLSLGKSMILTTRAGYRYIKINENHKDSTTSTGYASFYANGKDGDVVKVDWSGLYASAGILLAFGK